MHALVLLKMDSERMWYPSDRVPAPFPDDSRPPGWVRDYVARPHGVLGKAGAVKLK